MIDGPDKRGGSSPAQQTGIEDITSKAALERFIHETVEGLAINKVQGLAPQLASITKRLDDGGL